MSPAQNNRQSRPAPDKTPSMPLEVVDPIWLLKALALSFAAAVVCAWLALCALYYQGAWQLVLHPSRAVAHTPASVNLAFTPVRFGDFDTGQPHLAGWWVPAQAPAGAPLSAARYASLTLLYLHGGTGSLSDVLPDIAQLHSIGLNVFAIDYRGFGLSDASAHPSADRMAQDAAAALDYLVTTRHIPQNSIIPMGAGLGASLAVQLAHSHPALPAIILDNPDPDPASTAAAARRSHLIPIRLLFGDKFAIAGPLATLTTPKLFLAGGTSAQLKDANPIENLFHHAASPSYFVALPSGPTDAPFDDALRRFLDQYLPQR